MLEVVHDPARWGIVLGWQRPSFGCGWRLGLSERLVRSAFSCSPSAGRLFGTHSGLLGRAPFRLGFPQGASRLSGMPSRLSMLLGRWQGYGASFWWVVGRWNMVVGD